MGFRTSRLPVLFVALALAFTMVLSNQVRAGAEPQTSTNTAPANTAPGNVGKYNGPGACAASNCHGGVQPKTITRIPQNEYSIWAAQDKHARAYNVLSNPTSVRMGKILKLANAPNTSEKCLVCHALYVPKEARATTFQLDDGVSCENCHGPAVGWLGPHTTKGWKHEQSLKLGMYDTRNLISRTEKCLSCHLGTKDKQVDHEMIAAGHPDLTFELDSFSAVMPRHWKPAQDTSPWFNVQEWAVGQAVQLREDLNRLDRRVSAPNWPEFAELECFQCHHSLTKPEDSWRQARGYPGRRPGVPAWNSARYVVFRHVATEVNPEVGKQLNASLDKVSELIGNWGSKDQLAATSQQAAGLANQIAEQLQRQQYDADLTARVMQSIAADAQVISLDGERSAEQAAMALDSLSIAYAKNNKGVNEPDLRAAINKLFQQLDNPSAYNAPQFAAQMQRVRALLPRATQAASVGH
jgi:hypothetical protein